MQERYLEKDLKTNNVTININILNLYDTCAIYLKQQVILQISSIVKKDLHIKYCKSFFTIETKIFCFFKSNI